MHNLLAEDNTINALGVYNRGVENEHGYYIFRCSR